MKQHSVINQKRSELDPYQSLANSVILLAVKDYRRGLKMRKKRPQSGTARFLIEDAERFFKSDWFTVLTDVQGEWLINKIREEFKDD